jgi:SAM-dependent methyltransferase
MSESGHAGRAQRWWGILAGMTRWTSGAGDAAGEGYAARFDALAASGADVHGEATFVESLVPPGALVLDAGCGTGRVAIRLAERGLATVGVDLDPSMLAVARDRAPGLRWVEADLSSLDLGETFDLVVAAGNVVPLVAEGTEAQTVARLAAHVAAGGLLVAGFGLDREHLTSAATTLDLADYDSWCAAAGLVLERRLATWDGEPYDGGGYAVSVHRRPPADT